MSKKKDDCMSRAGQFGWNELVTTNKKAATKFYTSLIGWKTKPFGHGSDYTLLMAGKEMAGGLMQCPKKGNPAQWICYVVVKNVDATVMKALKLKGKICVPPMDIPDVGRIAVLQDPQGAAFGVFQPK